MSVCSTAAMIKARVSRYRSSSSNANTFASSSASGAFASEVSFSNTPSRICLVRIRLYRAATCAFSSTDESLYTVASGSRVFTKNALFTPGWSRSCASAAIIKENFSVCVTCVRGSVKTTYRYTVCVTSTACWKLWYALRRYPPSRRSRKFHTVFGAQKPSLAAVSASSEAFASSSSCRRSRPRLPNIISTYARASSLDIKSTSNAHVSMSLWSSVSGS